MPDPLNSTTPVIPGDLVQLTDPTHPLYTYVALVTEVKAWGCQAEITFPRPGGDPAVIPVRVLAGGFAVVGVPALLPPEVAKARRDAERAAS